MFDIFVQYCYERPQILVNVGGTSARKGRFTAVRNDISSARLALGTCCGV